MENKPKKSKAIIITIILIVVLLVAGYLIFKKDILNIKNSTGFAKIFSPLISSDNSTNLTTVDAQAGEDIKKGDNVSVFGTGTNNNPIVVKTSTNNGKVLGYADQDIPSGYTGKIITGKNNGLNNFWNSFSDFLGNINILDKKNNDTCSNGATNYPECNNNNSELCSNGAINPPLCNVLPNNTCLNLATNPPECNTFNNYYPTVTVAATPSSVKKGEGVSIISWTSTNADSCNAGTGRGTGTTGSFNVGPLTTSKSYSIVCTGPNGKAFGNVIVGIDGVITDPTLFPDVKIKADPSSVEKDGSSNISWTSTNSTSCDAGAGNGTGITGSFSTGPLTSSKSYVVTCTGPNGDNSNSVSVKVNGTGGDDGTGLPDITVSKVTPTSTIINTPTTLSSIVTNTGTAKTEGNFLGFFSIANSTGTNQTEIGVTVPSLSGMVGSVAKISYTFHSSETYYVRFCADKKSSSTPPPGDIIESNEDNNCSEITALTVTSSLAVPCLSTELLDTTVTPNKCIDKTLCVAPKVINGSNCENSGGDTSCLSTELLDTTVTPNKCIDKTLCTAPKVVNGDKCENGGNGEEENKCLLIAQNPLTFTDTEKAKLAELLRKFYVIAPTLKTDEDIAVIYKQMDDYASLIANVEDLTTQCYAQTLSKDGKYGIVYDTDGKVMKDLDGNIVYYTGPTLRSGNPWYQYPTRVSYIPANAVDANQPINYCTGSFNKKMRDQKNRKESCSDYKEKQSCEYHQYPGSIFEKSGLMITGCSWIGGTDVRDYEKILNIW